MEIAMLRQKELKDQIHRQKLRGDQDKVMKVKEYIISQMQVKEQLPPGNKDSS